MDEAGDHGACADPDAPIGRRFLCLLGVMVEVGETSARLSRSLEDLKRQHLPYDHDAPPVLHREDIVNRRGCFTCLIDEAVRAAFDAQLLEWLNVADYRVIAVVIDKHSHGTKTYRSLTHPYHYCLQALLERYCGLLSRLSAQGDVMAEARGAKEDRSLSEEYRKFYQRGSPYCGTQTAQITLTSGELKLQKKSANVAGLQLADVLAHPIKRDVLYALKRIGSRGGPFADRAAEIVEPKYNRHQTRGDIWGYGRVLLT